VNLQLLSYKSDALPLVDYTHAEQLHSSMTYISYKWQANSKTDCQPCSQTV